MNTPYAQRNLSPSAQRKISGLALSSGVDLPLVKLLVNLNWNFDIADWSGESIGWEENDRSDHDFTTALHSLADSLKIPTDIRITRDRATAELLESYNRPKQRAHISSVISSKNGPTLSELSSYYYIQGITTERAATLLWSDDIGIAEIAHALYRKICGGYIFDYLDYLWCDLVLPLPRKEPEEDQKGLTTLLAKLQTLPENSKLGDLIASCKGIVAGDKYYKQRVLELLSYARIITVADVAEDAFLPDFRDELSSHFSSNEWSFPLRFWGKRGGTIKE